VNDLSPLLAVLLDGFWAAIAALGFAILFNVPRRALPVCMLAGALGHATRTGLMTQGIAVEVAVLAGAVIVGLLGEFFQRRMKIPRIVFTVPGVIPMVPGSLAFGAMESLLGLSGADPAMATQLLTMASIDIIRTLLILIALGAGISIPILLKHGKPVV